MTTTTALQLGTLVTVAAIIARTFWHRQSRKSAVRIFRAIRRNEFVREAGAWLWMIGPYLAFVLLLASQERIGLAVWMLAAFAVSAVMLWTKQRRWGVVHVGLLAAVALWAYSIAGIEAAAVVGITPIFRELWASVR